MLLWFVAGIIVGWVAELLIDWSFWRRNAYPPNDIAAINELAALRRKVKEYEQQIQSLQKSSALQSAQSNLSTPKVSNSKE